ncbi:hypothetical protein SDC9_64417 [bioreactor metagenome]|uniref:Holin family protein n=1 Tax=bioreactor metagenome TaxID=1076179 RepID=A0A644XP96_9ZZZZ
MGVQSSKNIVLSMLAVLGAAFGGWSGTNGLLFICMAVDYGSGLMVGATGNSPKTEGGGLSSKVSFTGICRKMLIILLLIIANYADKALGVDYIRNATCYFFIGNEALSIFENAGLLGLPIPPKIKSVFEMLREKGNGDDNA